MLINGKQIKVGDGATIVYYSDRKPATIIEIGKNYIKVQEDKATRIDDYSILSSYGIRDVQDYKIERDPNGKIHTFKRTRKNRNVFTNNGKYYDWGTKLIFGGKINYYN